MNDEITFAKDPSNAEFIVTVLPKDEKGNSLGDAEKYTVTLTEEKDNSSKDNADSCNANYRLKEVTYNMSHSGGIYTMNFSFNFEKNSDMPATVSMYTRIIDCNDKTTNIAIKLKYDASSKTYTGSQAVTENKECELGLNYVAITASDACKNETVWEAEGDAKTGPFCCRIPQGGIVVKIKGR